METMMERALPRPDYLEVWLMQVACHNASEARARFRPRPVHCKLIRVDLRQRRAEVAACELLTALRWDHEQRTPCCRFP